MKPVPSAAKIVGIEEAAALVRRWREEGETVVFRPRGEGRFELLARVKADTWSKWTGLN